MKTTLNLDEHLLKKAKQRTAHEGTTLTAFVEDALQAKLNSRLFIEPTLTTQRNIGEPGPDVFICSANFSVFLMMKKDIR